MSCLLFANLCVATRCRPIIHRFSLLSQITDQGMTNTLFQNVVPLFFVIVTMLGLLYLVLMFILGPRESASQ